MMPMYNLIYVDNYSKTLEVYGYRDELALNNPGAIIDFPVDNNNNSVSFNFNQKIKRSNRCWWHQ